MGEQSKKKFQSFMARKNISPIKDDRKNTEEPLDLDQMKIFSTNNQNFHFNSNDHLDSQLGQSKLNLNIRSSKYM